MTLRTNIAGLWCIFLLHSTGANAASCSSDAATFYRLFKEYREQINTATRLEQLTGYFSTAFNQYYRKKIDTADQTAEKQRALTHYWDNLNTAKDIVIVFDYTIKCVNDSAILGLVSVLDTGQNKDRQEFDLWKVNIRLVLENDLWKISSFEYQHYDAPKPYRMADIKDNFVQIR